MALSRILRYREFDSAGASAFSSAVRERRDQSFEQSEQRIFVPENAFSGSSACSLSLDGVEHRYLLAGACDGGLACFDVQSHYHAQREGQQDLHEHLFRIQASPPETALPLDAQPRHHHQSATSSHRDEITSIQWYPVDTGLFLSSSKDCSARLWDANELKTVCSTTQESQINCVAMPEAASGHCLIALGAKDSVVRIWDPRSDCISLNFAGHIGLEVTCVAWSTSCEWILISGGSGGQIRLWDVRKANSLLVLDQYNTKNYSEGLNPMPDVEHLRQRSLKFPSAGDALMDRFDRNLQEWVSSKKLVKMVSDSKRNDMATAHDSAVRMLKASGDGLFLYSAAARMTEMRKWDLASGKNTLVNFELPASGLKAWNAAALDSSQNLFVAHNKAIFHLDTATGKRLSKLSGHYDRVTACVYNPACGELYSASLDGNILLWEAERLKSYGKHAEKEDGNGGRAQDFGNEDDWTTDED